MLTAQWPLVFIFLFFCQTADLSLSIFCSFLSICAPCNSPVLQGMMEWPAGEFSGRSGLFSRLGLCINWSQRASLSARGTIPLDFRHGFLVLLYSPATALASSPSSAPLMGGLGCLTFLTPPHPKCSTESVFSPSPQILLSLCGPTGTVHLNPLPLPFTRVWTCQMSVFKSPSFADRTLIMELLPEL